MSLFCIQPHFLFHNLTPVPSKSLQFCIILDCIIGGKSYYNSSNRSVHEIALLQMRTGAKKIRKKRKTRKRKNVGFMKFASG